MQGLVPASFRPWRICLAHRLGPDKKIIAPHFGSFYPLDEPAAAYSTARVWLLRLGYYQLTREKQVAEDWVWVIDHTVQIGEEKTVLIVRLRLSCLPAVGQPLRHEEVEPITLEPVKESTGEVVYHQLKEAARRTGVPREILSDHGTVCPRV